MSDKDDDKRSRDNTDPRLEPKKSNRHDLPPPGSIGFKSNPTFSQEQLSKQAPERNFSKENQLGKEMHQDRQADRQNALSKEFDAAKARESRDHFTPAPEGKDPNKNDDRQR